MERNATKWEQLKTTAEIANDKAQEQLQENEIKIKSLEAQVRADHKEVSKCTLELQELRAQQANATQPCIFLGWKTHAIASKREYRNWRDWMR